MNKKIIKLLINRVNHLVSPRAETVDAFRGHDPGWSTDMKQISILGIAALIVLLVFVPGVVSAADLSVSGSVVKADLTVTDIWPNQNAGDFLFANEPNTVSVTIENVGTGDAGASTVALDIGGTVTTAAVDPIAAGGSLVVTITDSTSYTANDATAVSATADSANVVDESDEANNGMTLDAANDGVFNNGYKGKRWTGGSDMTTKVGPFSGRVNVVYSRGNSVYYPKTPTWSTINAAWTSSDLPVPTGATIKSARLYQPWTYNKLTHDPAFTMSFNGNTVMPAATYKDVKGFGLYSYPYGLYAYDVTSQFNTAGNNIAITAEPGYDYGMYGAYMVVVYEHAGETNKQIFVNEEMDFVWSNPAYSVNDDEATVHAPFAGVDVTDMQSARAIAIVAGASASDAGKSKFFFNSNEYTGFWPDYQTTPQLGFSVYDIASAVTSGANEARLQSYKGTAVNGDNNYPLNTILVVEKTESAVDITDFDASPTSGDASLAVTFTPTATGNVVGYAWDFDNDGDTDSTEQTPTFTYDTPGVYSVKLTVTGPGTGNTDTMTKTNLVTVKTPAPDVTFTIDPTSGVEPLLVDFDATNTGGAVTSWKWEYSADGGTTWTEFATTEDVTDQSFNDGTYSIRVTATGPDYADTETQLNALTVGAAVIDVAVTESSIDFGTMTPGVDETGSTGVTVDVTGGTAWSVAAADLDTATKGHMATASDATLTNAFQLSNDGTNFQAMTSDFADFVTGAAGADGSDTANVKQAVATADAAGDYTITLTFTGSFS
jgi:PKD repeat protein